MSKIGLVLTKIISLLRLELNAAVLVVRLYKLIIKEVDLPYKTSHSGPIPCQCFNALEMKRIGSKFMSQIVSQKLKKKHLPINDTTSKVKITLLTFVAEA